ncbi:MAG: TetR/AcrR family transcriptional regulator [Pseudomonadota bacterium]
MQKTAQKTGYHHGDLREQLIATTRGLVEESGPDVFSVSEACRRAGVSTAAPYKHFTDREDLLRAVALQGFTEMTERFHAAVAPHVPGTLDAIAAVGTAYVAFAENNPGLFKMMFAASKDHPATEEAGHGCYGVVLNQIARYLGHAEVDDRVMEAGFPLWTFVHGLSFLRIDGKAEFAKMGASVEDIVTRATARLLPAPGA